MQPLYTEAEFQAAKHNQLLPLCCIYCGKTYYRNKQQISVSMQNAFPIGSFCSHSCSKAFHFPRITVRCKNCQKEFTKSPSQHSKHPNHFCSCSCAAKWNNAHKTKGTRVSKLEVWLQQKLPTLYPNLGFHFNRKDAINGELDIYIPSLKLAFELNGIFHYEPIYGPEKLAKMQTNDARKFAACQEHGVELCVIDSSSMKNFKEQRAIKFLTIITNIIDLRLTRPSESR